MRFQETRVQGAFLVELDKVADMRGHFARTWCQREFAQHGLSASLVQCSTSFNLSKGTLRGMHYQAAPHGEDKLVRCTRGAIYDVLIDLREDSPSFKCYHGETLNQDNGKMLFIPKGVAHGFLTLADDTEVFYQMSEFYVPEAGRGVRWNDPAFGVEWPSEIRVISDRDRSYPDFSPAGAC